MFQKGDFFFRFRDEISQKFSDVLTADPQICSLRRFIFARLSNWPRLCPRQRCCASVLQRRAARHSRSLTASRAWTQLGSIFTIGSALWTRCPLLTLRSAPPCWRSSACGLLPSFFLDRRKRISGRTWICSAVSPTHGAPNSLCIAFAPTSWSRTVWDQCLGMLPVLIHRQCLGLAMDGCTHARGRLSWRYWPLG